MSATDVIRELQELPWREREKVLRWLQQQGFKDLWASADAVMKNAPKLNEDEILKLPRVRPPRFYRLACSAGERRRLSSSAGVFGSVLHACGYSIPLRLGARKTRYQIPPNTGAGRRTSFKTHFSFAA